MRADRRVTARPSSLTYLSEKKPNQCWITRSGTALFSVSVARLCLKSFFIFVLRQAAGIFLSYLFF